MTTPKLTVATVSLAGCFGCHMSFLDIDERLFDLIEHLQFDRSPFTDIKTVGTTTGLCAGPDAAGRGAGRAKRRAG